MRRSLLALALFLVTAVPAAAEVAGVVYKDPDCHCCIKWVEHMARAGFALEARNVSKSQMVREKVRLGLSLPLAACHTAEIGGYVI